MAKTPEELKNYDGPGKVITSYDILDIIAEKEKNAPLVYNYNFNLLELDKATEGMRSGELILIAGEESAGKTALCRTLIRNLSTQDCRVLFFSCEEPPSRLVKKFGDQIPFFLWPDEVKETTLDWLYEKYREAEVKYKRVGAIAIDHLMYISDGVNTGDLKEDIWRVCRKLKRWAVTKNIVILLLHHTNRTEEKHELSTRSLYGSGGPGKESDTVLLIARDESVLNSSIVKLAKCRETGARIKTRLEYISPFFEQSYIPIEEPKKRSLREQFKEFKRGGDD